MVKRCVAMNCSKTHQDGVSLHRPTDTSLRLQWTRQVQRTRSNWTGPSQHSVICSDHFTSDCFEEDTAIAAQFGIEKRVRLKPNAVPTVFPRATSSSTSSSTQSPSVMVLVTSLVTDMGQQCSSRKRPGEEVSVPVEKKRTANEKERDLG